MSVNGKRRLTCYLYVKSVYNLCIICKDSDCISPGFSLGTVSLQSLAAVNCSQLQLKTACESSSRCVTIVAAKQPLSDPQASFDQGFREDIFNGSKK